MWWWRKCTLISVMEGERFQTVKKQNSDFLLVKCKHIPDDFCTKYSSKLTMMITFFVWQREHSDFCLNVKVIFFVSVRLLELIFQHGVKHNFYRLCVKFSGTIKGNYKLSCVTWHFTSSWCRCIYIAKYILMAIKTGLSKTRKKKLFIRTAD